MLLLAAAMAVPCLAHADIVACTRAHALGQREAKAGRLKAASDLFATCGSGEDCPEAIRAECVELYRDVEKSVPTVIFTATDAQADGHGRDITSVKVYAETQLLTESLDGRSIALDPGKYVFRFVQSEGEAVSTEVLIREGEKNRVISVRMPQPKLPPTPGINVASPEQGTQASSTSVAGANVPLPTEFWIAAGVGAATLASFGAFALIGHNLQSKLADCSPNCSNDRHRDYDSMRRDYLIADISLGVSLASVGVATWFFVANRSTGAVGNERSATFGTSRVSVLPLLSPVGIGAVVRTDAF